ncbi:unnamed protein product [Bursaphelenchus okinawaensis]|uniref:ABC-type xenobiotic transporter n=1 Tax=Bursaphelenchus okinawaensis TaxID=465554 RepID=A0A811L9I1_9BILA|nr:unnamed protein product [Bursaphelenchus okinawaensis]CAG9119829.1 unnamed protein product [Bursaphelenchus okinawaensis]
MQKPEWGHLCEWNLSEKSIWTKYIVDAKFQVLKSCAEFGIVFPVLTFLLFCSVLASFKAISANGFSNTGVRVLLYFRIFTVLNTVICYMGYFIFTLTGKFTLNPLLNFEQFVIAFVFMVYGSIYCNAVRTNTWIKHKHLIITYNITGIILLFVTYQRIRVLTFLHYQTYGYLCIGAFHLLNILLQVYEYRKYRAENIFTQLLDTESIFLDENADEGANFFSKLFFCWVNPLIVKGYKGQLKNVTNLFRVPPSLRVARIEELFFQNAPDEFVDDQKFSLFVGLLRTFGFKYFSLGLLRLMADLLTFAGPVLLHLLIVCLENGDPDNTGILYATLMMLCSFGSAICDFTFNFHMNKIALKVRCATLVALYDKVLTLPQNQLAHFSTGEIINFMSTDLDRIVSFVTSFHAFWSMPVNIMIALYLLYREMGLAFFSGLFCAVLMIPLNNYIASKIGNMSQSLMEFKDQRLKLVQEVLRAMRIVKLSNWEPFFEEKINKIRKEELRCLKYRKYLDAVCVYLWASAPLLITITILTTYTMIMGETLTAAKVFTSLALVNILILPLNAFPWVLNSLIEARVSKIRMDRFFALETMPLHCIYSLTESSDHLLVLEDARFEWNSGFSVSGINFVGPKGTIVGVSGGVASGKTTLLLGILGETYVPIDEQSSIRGVPLRTSIRIRQSTIHEGFAYVGQENWVRRGTIRENILCGSPMNEAYYYKVLKATALLNDIERMPGGDQYVIADEGSTLSGGQRARLALARAIYHENDVYILDDPFASLDRKVGRFVWQNAIQGILREKNRLVIVATHNSEFLQQCDHVVNLDAFGRVQSSQSPLATLPPSSEGKNDTITTSESGRIVEVENPKEAADLTHKVLVQDVADLPSTSKATVGQESEVESEETKLIEATEFVSPVVDERMEKGTVKMDIYWFYMDKVGFAFAILVGMALLCMQITKNMADAWLSKWTLNTTSNGSESVHDVFWRGERESDFMDSGDYNQAKYFLTVYVAIASLNTIFTLLRAFLFAKGGVMAAKNIHESLLKKVFASTVSWWEVTPFGRVVNRLCSDVYMVDDSLPFQLNICLASLLNLLGALILTVWALPYLIPIVILIYVVYYLIQRYYRHTTCEVKRITSLTLSPLYGHISDTVLGLVTIRAFRFTTRFMEKLRNLLEDNLSAQYTNLAASQWLSIRLQLLAVVMISAIAFIAVLENHLHTVESGLIGLAITYALTMTNVLNSLLSSFIDTEKELVSVERIMDYIHTIPVEDTNAETGNVDRFLYCRTAKGQVNFMGVCLRYASHLPLALSDVTFTIEAGKRVAIIGRTGAGKSSLFQALLKAHPVESGKIFIDGTIDIGQLDPKAVRSLFGVVNQTPFIFSGTIRENIKLNNDNVSDIEILELLEMAKLSLWLDRCGGLDAEVIEGGANFSYGERQIIQVCRLVLSKPKIVLIDEATAHMDDETHLIMNNIIRNKLETATVLSIVHRMKGIEHYDTVIEMANGTVISQGPPEDYLRQNL